MLLETTQNAYTTKSICGQESWSLFGCQEVQAYGTIKAHTLGQNTQSANTRLTTVYVRQKLRQQRANVQRGIIHLNTHRTPLSSIQQIRTA